MINSISYESLKRPSGGPYYTFEENGYTESKFTTQPCLKGELYLENLINQIHSAEKFGGGVFHAP